MKYIKNILKITSILFFLGFTTVSIADDNLENYGVQFQPKVDKKDPCTVFLCMAGKVMGSSSSECNSPEKTFFSIIGKKHGHFNPGRTFDARNAFLGQCKTADPSHVSKIMSKFGTVRL